MGARLPPTTVLNTIIFTQRYLPFPTSLLLSSLRDVLLKRPTDIRGFAAGRTLHLYFKNNYLNVMHLFVFVSEFGQKYIFLSAAHYGLIRSHFVFKNSCKLADIAVITED